MFSELMALKIRESYGRRIQNFLELEIKQDLFWL